MKKNAGNFWDIKGLGSEDVKYGPRSTPKEDNGKIEYTCKLSPYIIEENKQSIIHSLMTQFQGYEANPTIVAPQDSTSFTITVDSGVMPNHEVKEKLLNNYFIEGVSTRSDAHLRRNLHVDFNKSVASALGGCPQCGSNDLTVDYSSNRRRPVCNNCGMSGLSEWDRVDNEFDDPCTCNKYCFLDVNDNSHGSLEGALMNCKCDSCLPFKRDAKDYMHPGLSPKDQRHGTPAGYKAGCKCVSCTEAINQYANHGVRNASTHTAVPYHVSPSENRDSIEECGLLPGTEESNKWHSGIEPAVYMSKHPDDADLWASEIADARHRQNIYLDEDSGYDELPDSDYNDLLERHEEHPFDLYHVNTTGITTEHRNTDMGIPEIISKEPITPDRITHIKEFWASANGQGYDSAVDSNLHAETEEDPQYIIDQRDITDPQRTASISYEDPSLHHGIFQYLKNNYNWDENDRFGMQHSDYSSADPEKNLSLLHGVSSDAWGDECNCPLCSAARNIHVGDCSNCGETYFPSKDRIFILRPGTNIVKKNVWTHDPARNKYTCPNCISNIKESNKRWWEDE